MTRSQDSWNIHKVILVLCLIPLMIGLICFLIKYKELPDTIGIHFGWDEETGQSIFDVYNSKIFGLYPYVAGFVFTGLFRLIAFLAKRAKPSSKISEKGTAVMTQLVLYVADAYSIIVSIYFSVWAYCVIKQNPVPMQQWGLPLSIIFVFLIVGFPVSAIIMRIVYRTRNDRTKDSTDSMK